MKLTVIKPLTIVYIDSNVVDEDLPSYDPAVEYTVGDKVVFENSIYSCESPCLGRQPNESVEWYREQAVNSRALLDGQTTAQTTTTGTYIGEFTFIKCDTLAVVDCTGKTLVIEELDESGNAFATHEHIITEIEDTSDWYSFFLQEIPESATGNFEQRLQLDFTQRVRITVTGNNPSIGFIVAGRELDMGCVKWGMSPSFINPTPPIKNGFGNVTLVKGNYQTKLDLDIEFETKDLDSIYFRFANLQDEPVYVVAHSEYRALKSFGYIAHFVPIVGGLRYSTASVSIESFVKGRE